MQSKLVAGNRGGPELGGFAASGTTSTHQEDRRLTSRGTQCTLQPSLINSNVTCSKLNLPFFTTGFCVSRKVSAANRRVRPRTASLSLTLEDFRLPIASQRNALRATAEVMASSDPTRKKECMLMDRTAPKRGVSSGHDRQCPRMTHPDCHHKLMNRLELFLSPHHTRSFQDPGIKQ